MVFMSKPVLRLPRAGAAWAAAAVVAVTAGPAGSPSAGRCAANAATTTRLATIGSSPTPSRLASRWWRCWDGRRHEARSQQPGHRELVFAVAEAGGRRGVDDAVREARPASRSLSARWLESHARRVAVIDEEDVLPVLSWPGEQQAVVVGRLTECAPLLLDALGLRDSAVRLDPDHRDVARTPRNPLLLARRSQGARVEGHRGIFPPSSAEASLFGPSAAYGPPGLRARGEYSRRRLAGPCRRQPAEVLGDPGGGACQRRRRRPRASPRSCRPRAMILSTSSRSTGASPVGQQGGCPL